MLFSLKKHFTRLLLKRFTGNCVGNAVINVEKMKEKIVVYVQSVLTKEEIKTSNRMSFS